jgi:hypothetical protein
MNPLFQAAFRSLFPLPVTYDSSGNTLKEDIKDPQGTQMGITPNTPMMRWGTV